MSLSWALRLVTTYSRKRNRNMADQPIPQDTPAPQPDGQWNMSFLDALMSGAKNTYGQVKDDLGSLLQGSYNPGTMDRVGQVLGGLPIGQMLEQFGPVMGALGMGAKTFKPGADTLEGLIQGLAKAGTGIGSRARLQPAIKVGQGAGEIFASEPGGIHPTDLVTALLAKRGQAAGMGNMQYGFQVPGEKPFIPESLAHVLAFPEGVQKVSGLLQKGLSMDSILEAMKFAAENGRPFIRY